MNNIENVIARSQPEHKRSEDRLRFNHAERKPMVTVQFVKKKFFEFRKGKEFSVLDISPSGACLMHSMVGAPKISVNDQLIIRLPDGEKVFSEVKWVINNFEAPYSKEESLAVGIHLNFALTKEQIIHF